MGFSVVAGPQPIDRGNHFAVFGASLVSGRLDVGKNLADCIDGA